MENWAELVNSKGEKGGNMFMLSDLLEKLLKCAYIGRLLCLQKHNITRRKRCQGCE